MPDTKVPTAPVAAEGGETHPEATQQPPTSRQDLISSWLQEAAKPEPEKPADPPAKVEESPPEPATPAGVDLSQPVDKPPDAPPEQAKPAPEDDDKPADAETSADRDKLIARIRELKGKRRELKHEVGSKDAELATLRGEMAKLEAEVERLKPQPAAAVPFENETDPEAIASGVTEAEQVAARVQETLDSFDGENEAADVGRQLEDQGVKAPADGWTSKTVRTTLVNIRRNAERAARSGRERSQYLTTEQHALDTAARLVPELATDEALSREVQEILRTRPFLKLMPDWPLAAAAAALGLRELKRKQQPQPKAAPVAVAAPAVTKVPVPIPPRVPGAPKAATPPAPDEMEEVRERATRRGATEEDRMAYTRAMLARS